MKSSLLICALFATACGHAAAPDTTPVASHDNTAATTNQPADVVSPEVADQIQRALDRKRDPVAHCLGIAIGNQELPRTAHGKVALEIVIAPSGHASSVKVIKSDLDSKSLTECVIHLIQDIQFPTVPVPYERSYTYGFEAA